MKKIQFLSFVLVITLISCNQQTSVQPVDIEAEKALLNAVLDRIEAAASTDTLAFFMTADAMVTGTAPSEIWNKQKMVELWTKYYSGSIPEHAYINERKTKIAVDGNSATVLEELKMPVMSQVLPVRNTYHMIKINGRWMIDFLNICFIPENADLQKIGEALSK